MENCEDQSDLVVMHRLIFLLCIVAVKMIILLFRIIYFFSVSNESIEIHLKPKNVISQENMRQNNELFV